MEQVKYDIAEIYNDYLRKNDQINQTIRQSDSNGNFSASSAGLCVRKHWFEKMSYSKDPIDPKSLRNMNTGTILGADVEKAMKMYNFNDGSKVYTEEYIAHPEYTIGGHFDILIVDTNRKGHLIDIKTAHSYKFSTLFGRKKDPNPATNYAFQLGTYAWILNETQTLCDEVVYMENVYFNKNDANMKSLSVPLEFIDFAEEYWISVENNKNEKPALNNMVPMYTWECNYCRYASHCDSPNIKQKRK